MKKIIFLISILISVQLMFVSCEKEANLPWPDNIENGVIATIDLVVAEGDIHATEFSYTDLENASAQFVIGTPYDDEYETLQLTVAVKPKGAKAFDFGNQYVIAEYIKPGTYIVEFSDVVDAVDIYNSYEDVTLGDKYKFFVNVKSKTGKIFYAFLPLKRPSLEVKVEQETSASLSKIYTITPGKSNVGDLFEFKIDNSSATRVKVATTGGDVETILNDIIKAIDKKIEDKPTGKWATYVKEYSIKDGHIEVVGNLDTEFEITGTADLKVPEVSGYGPNILANLDYNFSENMIVK